MDVLAYFSEQDASNINWAHAVNTKEKLALFLKDDNTHMLEADIMFLSPTRTGVENQDVDLSRIPMMAHPPATESDISFKQWLDRVIASPGKKGIKLDFKDGDAVMPCLEELNMRKKEIDFPVWLNADVIPGPGAVTSHENTDGTTFLKQISTYPECTVSLSWSSTWKEDMKPGYSWKMVKEMHTLVTENNVKSSVTYPVCGYHLTHSSVVKMLWLTEMTGGNITVWENNKHHPVPVTRLLYARHIFSHEKVYYDLLPDSTKRDFDLHKQDPVTGILQIAEDEQQTKYLDIIQRVAPQIKNQWEKVPGSAAVFVASQSIVMCDGLVGSVKQYTVNDSRLIDLIGTVVFNCPLDKTEMFGVEIFFQVHDNTETDIYSSVRCYIGAEGRIMISVMGSSFRMQREEAVLPEPPDSIDFKITHSKHSLGISVCPSSVDSVDDTLEKGRCLTVSLDDLEDLEGHIVLKVADVDGAFLAFENLEILQS